MALYLVVAHQTAASPELVSKLRDVAAVDGEAEFVLLVPATSARHLLTWVEGEGAEIARDRANAATVELRRAGFTVRDTIVGPPDPLEAIRGELRASPRPYAKTIICTLPQGVSRWLHRDLPSQVRKLDVEVVHVVAGGLPAKRPAAPAEHAAVSAGPEASGPPLTLQELAAWRGSPVYSLNGVLGDLREILHDYVSGDPVWLGVASRPLPFRTLLVPAQGARVVDDRLVISLTRQRVLDQPHIDIGEGFASLTDEEHIYRYFGLPFDEVRDIRVLREGEPLPGGQRNWQNIIETESTPSTR
jgi:hypothetical protein